MSSTLRTSLSLALLASAYHRAHWPSTLATAGARLPCAAGLVLRRNQLWLPSTCNDHTAQMLSSGITTLTASLRSVLSQPILTEASVNTRLQPMSSRRPCSGCNSGGRTTQEVGSMSTPSTLSVPTKRRTQLPGSIFQTAIGLSSRCVCMASTIACIRISRSVCASSGPLMLLSRNCRTKQPTSTRCTPELPSMLIADDAVRARDCTRALSESIELYINESFMSAPDTASSCAGLGARPC
mmetsp:Transcript_111532/g.315441  ORF Transcript_111532/g.315441 Transcript_111532/m.315441 type:complete len:240 (-) Transcript_111532:340-1059(-)